jgi:hypothetical protein
MDNDKITSFLLPGLIPKIPITAAHMNKVNKMLFYNTYGVELYNNNSNFKQFK